MSKTGLEAAVIGMAGRFPGAGHIDAFWDNLKNGVESIAFFSQEELIEAGVNPGLVKDPNYVKALGFLNDSEYFDASFFGYTPNEAVLMDPQMRIFHECAWEALEDAGYVPDTYSGLIGLYAGASPNFNWEAETVLSGGSASMGTFAAGHYRDKDFLALRISYKLNLSGPALGVYTACSTSLVAIHLAWQGLLNGECDLALAGGITMVHLKKTGYRYQEGMILSPDGHCRAFSANSRGVLAGDGAGIVVLKRLEEAEAEGDHIYAIIKGSAINNDGIRKPGFTAPSVEGQAEVIKTALHMAEVEPDTITYIETHGTGTELGDPVEIEGLKLAYHIEKKNMCPIGSVKTNIGHLDSAAGAAGFIKTVLALTHKLIPPGLHFDSPNPTLKIENSPFYVNTGLSEWKCPVYPVSPRRAGVSSFGIGGTNAHMILEEAPQKESKESSPVTRPFHLLVFSANSETALDQITGNFTRFLEKNPQTNLAHAAYTLQLGRKTFAHKRQLVGADVKDVIDILSSPGSRKIQTYFSPQEENRGKPVVFIFPGLGAQYVNMGLGLYRDEPVFRREMDRGFEILGSLGCEIKDNLYPPDNRPEPGEKILQPSISHPLIFLFEYALARMLMEWGITPRVMMGYSFGEYAAACLSGVFSLEQALEMVLARGRLIELVPEGIMISAPLTREELQPYLNADLSVSIDNGSSCIVSGAAPAIDSFEKQMKAHRCMCMRLNSTHAYHSKMMEPISDEFEKKVKEVSLQKAQIPYISNVTGTWLTDAQALDPAYWKKHLLSTVRFADGLDTILEEDSLVFVEVGPGRDLTAMAARYIEKDKKHRAINLIRPPEKDIADSYYLMTRIGQLWMYGVKIDWQKMYPGAGENQCRISLPAYPFERQHFPGKGLPSQLTAGNLPQSSALQEESFENWFYIPSWKRSLPVTPKPAVFDAESHWLIFSDDSGFSSHLSTLLDREVQEIITVKIGTEFHKVNDREYTINPSEPDHYHDLFKDLAAAGRIPGKIVHLWSFAPKDSSALDKESVDKVQEYGFYSILYLVKSVTAQHFAGELQVFIVTGQVQEVTGEETLHPAKATILGAAKVVPQEFPGIRCRNIDLELPAPGSAQEKKLVTRLLAELKRESPDPVIAYRAGHRWEQIFAPICLEETEGDETFHPLKQQGVYLVTGGLGKIGLVLAEYLARSVKARLILTGRREFPPREQWDHRVSAHDPQEAITQKILKVKHLEELGAEVLVICADTGNYQQMQRVIARAEESFGQINGVIHCAGLLRGESIKTLGQLSPKECQLQFQAKVYGVLVLDALFKEKNPDFCWLMSSISSVLGGLEFTAYSAANIFMDTFVNRLNRANNTNNTKWISVNWDNMEPEQTAAAFQRILSLAAGEGEVNQLVVSTGGNLQARIDRWIKLETLRAEEEPDIETPAAVYPRPNVLNDFIPPRTPTQQAIADIWGKLFGFEEVGILDDFLELGGDSLKAITVISRIHKVFSVSIPLVLFFNKPNIKELAAYIDGTKKDVYSSIQASEKKEFYRLSSAQQRLYALQLLEKDNTIYNESLAVLLEGTLEVTGLEQSFRKMIRRHENLRTSIIIPEYEPMQKVHAPGQVEPDMQCRQYDENRGDHESHEKIMAWIRNFIKPFDLGKAPSFRIGLVKMAENKHVLVIDMHHIVTDGVSLNMFITEVMQFYRGSELLPLRIQYKDYAEWQNREVEIKKQEEYWLNCFTGSLPMLNLPTDFERPMVQGFEGNSLRFEIGNKETGLLKKLALEQGVTMYMFFLAIYNILLSKISGQEDIIVGTVIKGRPHEDLDHIIGMFVNTMALRTFPFGSLTFLEFLKKVKEVTLGAFDNGDYPFENLVEKVVKNRDVSRNPLFDVAFEFQNVEMSRVEIPQLELKPFGYSKKVSIFDMDFRGNEVKDKVYFIVEYNIALFKASTIEKFVSYFKEIVTAVIENPGQKLSEIEILSKEQKGQLIKKIRDEKGKSFLDKNIEKNRNYQEQEQAEAEFDF